MLFYSNFAEVVLSNLITTLFNDIVPGTYQDHCCWILCQYFGLITWAWAVVAAGGRTQNKSNVF